MPTYRDRYWHDSNLAAVRTLSATAANEGWSLVSLALCWLLHHTPVDCVILGASRPEQLQENLSAGAQGPMSSQAVAECDRVWSNLRGPQPQYHR
jgi:aflatoxin B1 aldehyde reductase